MFALFQYLSVRVKREIMGIRHGLGEYILTHTASSPNGV